MSLESPVGSSAGQGPEPAAPFGQPGSWPSPISAALVAAAGTKINEVKASGNRLWWLETRPEEDGRAVVVSAPNDGSGPAQDCFGQPWSSRTRVHEYGGGSWWLGRDDLYFVSADDQRIYTVPAAPDNGVVDQREPRPLTPAPPQPKGWCYADGQAHPDGSVLVCVREDHHVAGDGGAGHHAEPVNSIVVVPVDGGEPTVIIDGADFYQCPRISPDGRWLSWVEWNHPNMPWQETALKVAPLFGQGSAKRPIRVGNEQSVAAGSAIHGANWTTDGRLIYSSDETGYWNLWWWTEGTGGRLTDLHDAEIGYPPWIFGIQQWTDLTDGRLVAIMTRNAVDTLAVVSRDGSVRPLPGFRHSSEFDADSTVRIDAVAATSLGDHAAVAIIASTPARPPQISVHGVEPGRDATPGSPTEPVIVRPADGTDLDAAWLSVPTSIWFESNGRSTQAFLYLPPHDPGSTRPPLIVIGHGGPTAHNSPALSLKVQYWTSRGFAVADVNYGGSSGFGKQYRDRLHQAWGVVDVEDCINVARHLAATDVVDGRRMAIRGSSSGGLTVLLALIQSSEFSAGVSLYGVTDLAALAADTHKFERHYIDWLVGAYPAEANRFAERSPANLLAGLETPMLLMQGTEDKVVPPSQSEVVVDALRAKGVPHLYVTFEGEGHGLRQAQSLITSLEAELWFYTKIFGFEPAEPLTAPTGAVGLGLGLDL